MHLGMRPNHCSKCNPIRKASGHIQTERIFPSPPFPPLRAMIRPQAQDKHAHGLGEGRERKGGKGVREGCKPTTLATRLNIELLGGACLTLLPKARHAGGIADGDAL